MKRYTLMMVLVLLLAPVALFGLLGCAETSVRAQGELDEFLYLPLVVKGYDPPTPTPTPTPAPMTELYLYTGSMNDYPVVYEVYETGIGQKTYFPSSSLKYYGTFPSGTYRISYGSPACKVQAYEKYFRAGVVEHTLFCALPFGE